MVLTQWREVLVVASSNEIALPAEDLEEEAVLVVVDFVPLAVSDVLEGFIDLLPHVGQGLMSDQEAASRDDGQDHDEGDDGHPYRIPDDYALLYRHFPLTP